MKISNNKILITGGATGIGFGLAERFLKANNTVIICGRRGSVLKQVTDKYPEVLTKICDLTLADDRIELFDWINKYHSDLNVLINNAGIQQWMSIDDDNFYVRASQEISTNIEAPVHLSSLFIKLESLQTIINVTSGLAFVPRVQVANYCATKAFFHSFTLSLRQILKPKNIEVIEIIPPAINTDLGGKGLHDFAPPVSELIESVFNQLENNKEEITFGMSEKLSKLNHDEFQEVFDGMNR